MCEKLKAPGVRGRRIRSAPITIESTIVVSSLGPKWLKSKKRSLNIILKFLGDYFFYFADS